MGKNESKRRQHIHFNSFQAANITQKNKSLICSYIKGGQNEILVDQKREYRNVSRMFCFWRFQIYIKIKKEFLFYCAIKIGQKEIIVGQNWSKILPL